MSMEHDLYTMALDLNPAEHLGGFWKVLDRILHHRHDNTKWGNVFWKMGVQQKKSSRIL